ncbi:reverse transcriptase domain-containing protein [Tanacetum coccineum]|uniref:Reverse transcriptase domain-containing protein n=1 Tax=Tanacetum coccineum TaxID=301880 RepID=A0ABQ5EIW6_9ASTR
MTGIPRAIMEHSLDTYPHIEPKAQKKRSLAPDRRKVVTNEVNVWLKAGIVRRVRYPTWVANPVLVKKVDGSWRMYIDFKDLNKACLKDLYPLPEIDWKIESLMGFQYKCFLDAYKGYHQIQMTKKDEEKTAFYTKEGVFCYTKMPFGLKNAGATYQRLGDSAFKEQIGVNLETYVDDMVIKIRTEQAIIKDIEQTFSTLRRINMKLNLNKCLFGIEEGKFLGYIVTSEGIRANPKKAKAVMDMPSPKTLKQMQSLSGKLAALNRFLSKWTKAAEAAFLEIKKLVSELPTLTTPKKGETLMKYLAVANEAVSAVLLMERDGRKMPIHYVAVKGQVLADFLADTPTEINVTSGVTNNPRVEDIQESSNARENLTPGPRVGYKPHHADPAVLVLRFCGSEAGLILIAPDDVEYSYVLRLNFSNFNNDAEYEALLTGLRIAKEMQVKDMHAFVDSKLVASQVEGSYKAKAENRKADALSKLAAVQFDHFSKEVLVEKGKLPEDPVDVRTLMEKIRNYTMEDGVLYRKSYLVVAKAINLGCYWPSMHRDGRELIRACDDCQAHASVPRLPKADMISFTTPRNEAVERANRSLLRGIKTSLEKGGSSWAEEVPNVLWAHRTIKKTNNGETSFSLTYGTEAVIPAEIGMPTHKTSNVNEKTNDQELRLNLDLLDKRREIVAIREA